MALGRDFRIQLRGIPTPDKAIWKPPANGLIETPALGRRAEQGLVNRRGNIEVNVNRLATKLQLQQFSGFVVGN
jgi:hypothetical protein